MIDLRDIVSLADEAFALDWYKEDKYTSIGQAVHDIKYDYLPKNNLSDDGCRECIDLLVQKLMPFAEDIDIIMPVPSFNPRYSDNPNGDYKIMYIVAWYLGQFSHKPVDFSTLKKLSSKQAKDSELLSSDYSCDKLSDTVNKVLLIDDLFGEGNTAKFTVNALKNSNPHVFVKFVSLTKNKYGGIHKLQECRISKFNPHHVSDSGKESIELYFYSNKKAEKVKIWSDNNQFETVKKALDEKDFSKIFEFPVYRNQRGYWQIENK